MHRTRLEGYEAVLLRTLRCMLELHPVIQAVQRGGTRGAKAGEQLHRTDALPTWTLNATLVVFWNIKEG